MNAELLEKITTEFKKLTAEYERLELIVRDLDEKLQAFQDAAAEAESRFGMFRRLYWNIRDMMKAACAPSNAAPPENVKPSHNDSDIEVPK